MEREQITLGQQPVIEIMSRDVLTVSANQTMAQAAAVLVEHGHSSAPVVDEKGRCVGMLSSEDFLRREGGLGDESEHGDPAAKEHLLLRPRPFAPFHIDECRGDLVCAHMSPAVQSIAPEATVVEAARALLGAQLHRLPVLDASSRPVGMVSSLDVLAALAQQEGPSAVRRPK